MVRDFRSSQGISRTGRTEVQPSDLYCGVGMDSVFRELNNGGSILDLGGALSPLGQEFETVGPVRSSSRKDFVHAVRVNRSERVIGWYPSIVAGRSQPYHSSLELDWLRLLDVTPSVEQLKAQPRTVKVWYGGEEHRYTPDTEVVLENGRRIIIEVKPYEYALKPKFKLVWRAIRERFADEGTGFKIVTDRYLKIRQKTTLELQISNTWAPDPHISFRLSEILAGGAFEPLGELISEFPNPEEAQRTVMSLVRRRRLLVDLSKPIDNDLQISLVRPEWM